MTWPFPAADSDAMHLDRALDDLATGDDIYDPSYEPPFGSVHVAVLAATASAPSAGSYPADARATTLPSRGRAGLSDL